MSNIKADPYLALRNKEFQSFLAMRMFLTLSIQIQSVVVAWQVYELSNKDLLALGMIGLTEAIPAIAVSLYAGHLVDMHSRRKIITKVLLALCITSVILLFFSLDISKFLGIKALYPIYAVIFVTGLCRGFLAPSFFAFLNQLVSKEELPNAISWNSTNWETAAVVGPALGGLMYGLLGVQTSYLIQCILLFLSLYFAYRITQKPSPPKPESYKLSERLLSGFQFVLGHKLILAAISLDLLAVLFGGAVALLPAFASDILKIGPIGMGFLRAAPALGAILIAIVIAYKPIKQGAGNILLYSVTGFGLCMIVFALSQNFWLSLGILFLSGVFDSVSVIIRSNILQLNTPEEMKGRVSSVNSIFISSSNEIGAFESGVAAKLMGLVPSVVFGGVMTLLVVLITAVYAKKLRKLNF